MGQLDWEARLARFKSLYISPTTSLHNIKPKSFLYDGHRELGAGVDTTHFKIIATLCKT